MKRYAKQLGVINRQCSKCNDDLGDRYGKQRYCKKCHAEWMRKFRPKHRELKDGARKKANARSYANVYLKRGIIKKQPCYICGSPAQMHHEDYSKPLEIIWICRKHHLELHNGKDQNKRQEIQLS